MEKNLIKLLGIIILDVIASVLLVLLDKELDSFSYFYGAITGFWLWFADDNF